MAFEEGHPKFGGRKKGTPNKSTAAARKLALATLGDLGQYAANARERIRAGKAPRLETKLLEYLFGPPRPVEVRDPFEERLALEDGRRLGTYIDADPLRGLSAAPGHSVLVATQTSRVIELSWPSLVQLDEYAVAGHLTGAGARVGERTFFGSDDGQMYVFQTSR